jgi:hypothetical protein
MSVDSFSAEAKILREQFNNNFILDFPHMEIIWPNMKGKSNGNSWVRFTIITGTGNQKSTGSEKNLHRHTGILIVEIFIPLNQGDKEGLDIADKIQSYFIGFQSGGLVCRTPSLDQVGQSENWFKLNVNVPFFRDALL